MEIFDNIKAIITEAEEDVSKFYENGNKAAAVRIRKAMQDIKKLAQDLRVHVQETKNNL
jgi:rubrerythrin